MWKHPTHQDSFYGTCQICCCLCHFRFKKYIWILARIILAASPRICRHISCNLPTCTYPFSDPEARCWLKNPIKKRVCGVGVRYACPTRFSSGEGPSWNVRTKGTKTCSAVGKIHGSKTCLWWQVNSHSNMSDPLITCRKRPYAFCGFPHLCPPSENCPVFITASCTTIYHLPYLF